MKREMIIQRQGRDFVLYAGLVDEAHDKGLTSIATEAITVTATLAVFKATASFKDGRVFTGHGDATPENVGRNIAPHFIRMAETRAKARALRDALNVAAASIEELTADDDPPPAPRPQPRQQPASNVPPTPAPAPESAVRERTELERQARAMNPPNAAAHVAGTGDIATPSQVRAIYLLGRDKQGLDDSAVDARSKTVYGVLPAELTKKQASDLITALQGERVAAS